MTEIKVSRNSGDHIRRLREERGLRPVDIQRISEMVRLQKNCPDFGISHATLNDIENEHSVPNVRKMFSLAVCFRIPLDHILALYDAAPGDVQHFHEESSGEETRMEAVDPAFVLQFDTAFDVRQTGPVTSNITQRPELPIPLRSRLDPANYSYAWIGTQDDAMADLIPAGSLVEVDCSQTSVEVATWATLRQRPIYFCWTKDGYRCSWCERNEDGLTLLPHPVSPAKTRRYHGREAIVIGRVTQAWVPFTTAKAS
jgi:transcriptional regulator with XRE-family HTH domain